MSFLKNTWTMVCFVSSLFTISRKKWKYVSEEKFLIREIELEMGNEKRAMKQTLSFWTHDILPPKPITLNILFSETYPYAKHFNSLMCTLKDDKGNILLLETKEQYLEFFDGEHLQKKKITAKISDLIPVLKNVSTITYSFEFFAKMKKYPDHLTLNIEMNWENEQKIIEMNLVKTVASRAKINPKF